MVSDGNLCSRYHAVDSSVYGKVIQLSSIDQDMIEKFSRFLCSSHKIICRTRKSETGYGRPKLSYQFAITNSTLYDDLVALGLKERKSLDIKWNGDKVPLQFMPDYIRGLWDGDGGIYLPRKRQGFSCSFTSSSESFMCGLNDYLDSVLSLSKHTICDRERGNSLLSLFGDNARKLCRYIYHKDMKDAYLTRKYNVWKEYEKRNI